MGPRASNQWWERIRTSVVQLTRRAFGVLPVLTTALCLAGLCGCGHVLQPGYTSRAFRLLEISDDLEGLGEGPGFGQLLPESLSTATSGWTVPKDPETGTAGPATQPTSRPMNNPTSNPSTAPASQPGDAEVATP